MMWKRSLRRDGVVASLKDTTPVGNHLLSCVILSHIVTAGLCHQQDFVEMRVCDFLNGREKANLSGCLQRLQIAQS